jgi:hypothetical protein
VEWQGEFRAAVISCHQAGRQRAGVKKQTNGGGGGGCEIGWEWNCYLACG